MTESERRGAELARDLLARELLGGNHNDNDADIQAGIDWLNNQMAIDTKRRQPRGFKYRR
jgi:hypothetical protein